MSRTPTYVRVNVDEIATLHLDTVVAMCRDRGELLMIEDYRSAGLGGVIVPDDWYAAADKVVLGSVVKKDNQAPIDPTQRKGVTF